MQGFLGTANWPPLVSLYRVLLALGIGMFVGLEREWRGKEAGLRTFGFAALLGALGGLLGEAYAIVSICLLGILVFILNWQSLKTHNNTVLTTSIALLVTGVIGVLCGVGHTVTPAAVGVIAAGLLAWKERLAVFSHNLTAEEVRSGILLAILAFVIYPLLPATPVDRWGLVVPKTEFVTVIIIALIGLINYILMKIFGPRGMELTAFFGGLVNSRKVIVELTTRLQSMGDALLPSVYRGIILATGSMLLRNVIIVGLFAPDALLYSIVPFALMLACSLLLWLRAPAQPQAQTNEAAPLALESPFRLSAALTFGLTFMFLNIAGALMQRYFGSQSFYFVSVLGGLLSSGSSIASATTLMNHHELPLIVGVTGVILSSLTSILINIPLIRSITKEPAFKRKTFLSLVLIALAGLVGVVINQLFLHVV